MRKIIISTSSLGLLLGVYYWFLPPCPLQELLVPEKGFGLVFSPNSSELLTYPPSWRPRESRTDLVRIWNLSTGKVGLVLPEKTLKEICKASYSPDGKTILIQYGDGETIAYSASGQQLFQIHDAGLVISPDSRFIIATECTEGFKYSTAIWRIDGGGLECKFPGGFEATFNSKGNQFVLCNRERVMLWELDEAGHPQKIVEHSTLHENNKVAADLDIFVSRKSDGIKETTEILLFDLRSGKQLKRFEPPWPRINGFFMPRTNLAYCSADRFVVYQHSGFPCSPTFTTEMRCLVTDWTKSSMPYDDDGDLLMSNCGRWLAAGGPHGVLLFDMRKMCDHLRIRFPGYWTMFSKFGFSANGEQLSVKSDDEGWRCPGVDILERLIGNPNANLFPLKSDRQSMVRVWNTADKKEILTILGGENAVFSPDSSRVASLHKDGLVKIWSISHHADWALVIGLATGSWVLLVTATLGLRFLLGRWRRHSTSAFLVGPRTVSQ